MKVVNVDGLRRPVSGGGAAVAAFAAQPIFAIPRPSRQPVQAMPRPLRMVDDIRRPLPAPAVVAGPSLAETTISWQPSARNASSLLAIPMLGIMVAGTIWSHNIPVKRRATTTTSAATATPATTVASTPSVEKTAVAPAAVPAIDTAALQSLVDSFTTAQPASFGIVIKDLATGATVSSNPAVGMKSASLYKLFVAAEIYRQVDNGSLTFGSDVPGTGGNVQSCLTAMIEVSDNNCGVGLGNMIGWGKQNAKLATLGFQNTSLAQPQSTSAADVALLLERLNNGSLLSPATTQHFMGLLKSQRVNNRLPIGLPAGTTVAHKTGDLDGWVHDAGIVFGPRSTYIVSVMSGQWTTPGLAPAAFAELSAKVYAFLNK